MSKQTTTDTQKVYSITDQESKWVQIRAINTQIKNLEKEKRKLLSEVRA